MGVVMALAALPLSGLRSGRRVQPSDDEPALLQTALDAATLAVARSGVTDEAEQDRMALGAEGDPCLEREGSDWGPVDFSRTNGVVSGTARVWLSPIIAHMVYPEGMSIYVTRKRSCWGRRSRSHWSSTFPTRWNGPTRASQKTANTRLSHAKLASTSFIDHLDAAARETGVSDALKISVVPFNGTVNPGMTTQPWIDANIDKLNQSSASDDAFFGARPNRFALLASMGRTWSGCVESRPMPYDAREDAPTAAVPDTLFVPYFAPDEHDGWGQPPSSNNYLPDGVTGTWNVTMQNMAKYTRQSFIHTATMYYQEAPGPDYECTLQSILRLTPSAAAAKARLASLTTAGNTNLGLGMMWGWHTLSPVGPFGDGAAYDPVVTRKVIVLLTDGENSIHFSGIVPLGSVYSSIGYLSNGRIGISTGDAAARTAALNLRLEAVCENIKGRDIEVYVVRIGDAPSSSPLRACASGHDKYYTVASDGSGLSGAFASVADSILNLRITR
jgi:hypothetical protein